MNSSMLAGERRRASSRRGGMTILGKVAVPKPLNLPSQRLENHGQDPNVEIVPKEADQGGFLRKLFFRKHKAQRNRGTLSWGSHSSSSVSSPWGSSIVSQNTDGGTSLTSYLGGCPSSGGSGTRPSTAGSDRTHEPIDSAWCSNSRPSSVSGVLSSNQTSLTSLCPESAETRPNSSHVSRFVEPMSGSLVTWGPNSTTEGTGVTCFKEDGFSSSSGDFPRLGSDRDNGKNSESQDNDHGCARSASGRIPQINEKSTSQAGYASVSSDVKGGSGRKTPQQHFNADVTFQHFDAWRAPPVNAPASVWYSGPPGGPPFRGHVTRGCFPMESFPYYRPQMPPPALARPQPVPPPWPDLCGGPHPKKTHIYRPQMFDAFPHPGMPFQPGFYPGPTAYDSYYGPMRYYNTSGWDVPYYGSPMGQPVMSSQKNEWRPSDDTKDVYPKSTPLGENSCPSFKHGGHSSSTVEVKSLGGGMGNLKVANDCCTERSEILSFPPEMPKQAMGTEGVSSLSAKMEELIHKIDSLNAKIHASDGRPDVPFSSIRAEQRNRSDDIDANISNSGGSLERLPASNQVSIPAGDQMSQPITVLSRKFTSKDADGWEKRPTTAESSSVTPSSVDPIFNIQGSDHNFFIEAAPTPAILLSGKEDGESMAESTDSTESQPQMGELAKQRALQLQKEEEERIREQKAKVFAKLQELNRQALAVAAEIQQAVKAQAAGIEKEASDALEAPKGIADVSFNNIEEKAANSSEGAPSDESNASNISNGKPHQNRTTPINQQGIRFIDKFHRNNTVTWSPVRQKNKHEGAVETSEKSIPESSSPAMTDNIAQSSLKSKQAEMGRCVLKPVAKKLAQQGNILPVTSSRVKGVNAGSSLMCGPSKDAEKLMAQNKVVKREVNSGTKAFSKTSGPNTCNISGSTGIAVCGKSPAWKDQGVTGRGKQHYSTSHSGVENNDYHRCKNDIRGETEEMCSICSF